MIIYHCFPGGVYKALTMSYDDGCTEDRRLVEIFNRHGIKGTFNINASWLGNPDTVTAEEVRTLYAGHEVATHTLTHPAAARCPLMSLAEEILEDRKKLEAVTGGLVRGHAYPFGSYNEEMARLYRSLGIAYGRITSPTYNSQGQLNDPLRQQAPFSFAMPADPMCWLPTCHHNAPNLMELGRRLVESKRRVSLQLMYVWGHGYEFSRHDNWHVIEEFCATVGGKDDIWYATSIEIIDYMEVLKRLQFTCDCTKVYNPSTQSAWLEVNDCKIVEVPGGALVDLTK